MKIAKFIAPIACGISALHLAAPASFAADNAVKIEPVVVVRHADNSADALYQVGRNHQDAKRLDDAVASFRAALEKDDNHIEARNALATAYFEKKDVPAAIAEFKILLQKKPGLSHVHSNLGYAYLLQNNYPAALSELAQAIVIEPGNTRAFGNLTLAYERLAEMAKKGRNKPAPAPVADARKMAEQVPVAEAAPTVNAPKASSTQDAAPKAATAGILAASGLIEIVNGTRDAALAERIADGMRKHGAKIDRVSELPPYTQRRTVILYRDGYRKTALELSGMFAVPPKIVKNAHAPSTEDRSAVRVVLGKTAANVKIRATAATSQAASQ